jgi:hypothetical protein
MDPDTQYKQQKGGQGNFLHDTDRFLACRRWQPRPTHPGSRGMQDPDLPRNFLAETLPGDTDLEAG